jgi:signal transduction histidine kinase
LTNPPSTTRSAHADRVFRVNLPDVRTALPVTGVRLSLWRAVALFRLAALTVCVFLIVRWQPIYARPGVAIAAAIAMAVVTAVIVGLAVVGQAHRWSVVAADIVLTVGLTLLTVPAQTGAQQHGGMVTLTTIWAAGPTIEAAFVAGPVGGLAAAAVQFVTAASIVGTWPGRTLYSGVLLIVTGLVVGYVASLVVRAERELQTASAAQAALAERERLARSIHDGVLQVLGLVHRAGRDADGHWAALGAEAGRQEAALRGLITSAPPVSAGVADLAGELHGLRSGTVTVSAPADPVGVPAAVAREVGAAVRAALDNVVAHAGDGARAWVLLEALDGELRVTVRDDGAGFADGRLAAAERDGRLGVARSIRGRIADLGGHCTITSTPEGTTVEMSVPWSG